jgi:hypothetical protein
MSQVTLTHCLGVPLKLLIQEQKVIIINLVAIELWIRLLCLLSSWQGWQHGSYGLLRSCRHYGRLLLYSWQHGVCQLSMQSRALETPDRTEVCSITITIISMISCDLHPPKHSPWFAKWSQCSENSCFRVGMLQ